MASERLEVVEEIERAPGDKSGKIVKLLAVVFLFYRQPTGDAAWEALRRLTDLETTNAIAFWTGITCGAGKFPSQKKLLDLVPELGGKA